MNTTELNELAQRIHKCNEKWWQHPVTKERIERNRGELLMLAVTEISEGCEGERRDLMDDKLPHRRMAEVEMADAYIRLCDFAEGFGYKLGGYYLEELFDNKGENLLWIVTAIVRIYNNPDAVELALSRIEAYCKHYNYDLFGAIKEKLAYNATREDHTHEARLQADGKKW